MEILLTILKTPLWLFVVAWKLIRWIATKAGAISIKRLLCHAHRVHLELRNWQHQWEPLAKDLEYKAVMASIATNNRSPISYIYIRNTGSELVEFNLYVVARSGMRQFSETVPISLAPGREEPVELSRIPLQDIHVQDEKIYLAYDDFGVVAKQITRNGVTEYVTSSIPYLSPSYSDFFNSRWWRFEGYLYNLDAIYDYKTDLLHKLSYHLTGRFGLISLEPTQQFKQVFRHHRYWLLPNIALYALMSRNWVLMTMTWCWLILHPSKLRFIRPGTPAN